MNLTELISADPDGRGYAAMSDTQVADDLNERRYTHRPPGVRITELTVIAGLGPVQADTVLSKLEARAQTADALGKALARVIKLFSPSQGGIDINHAQTASMVAALVADTTLTQAEADSLLGLGDRPASLAEINGLGQVHHLDVAQARGGS